MKLPTKIKSERIIFFVAFALYLGLVENFLPRPIPFFRLGLTNLSLLFALPILSSREFFLVAFLKVLIVSVLSGTIFSQLFLFSLIGTIFSASAMFCLFKIGCGKFSFVAISLLGAFCHAAGQLLVARFTVFASESIFIALPLFVASSISGIVLGIICSFYLPKFDEEMILKATQCEVVLDRKKFSASKIFITIVFFLVILVSIFFFSILKSFVLKFLLMSLMIFIFLCLDFRRNAKKILFSLMTFFVIVLINLIDLNGQLLFEIGGLKITQRAFANGVGKGAYFVGLIFYSRLAIWFFKDAAKAIPLFAKTLTVVDYFGEHLNFLRWNLVGNAYSKSEKNLCNRKSRSSAGTVSSSKNKKILIGIFLILFLFGLFFIAKIAENKIEIDQIFFDFLRS